MASFSNEFLLVLFMVLRRPLLFLFLPKRDFITALAVMPAGT